MPQRTAPADRLEASADGALAIAAPLLLLQIALPDVGIGVCLAAAMLRLVLPIAAIAAQGPPPLILVHVRDANPTPVPAEGPSNRPPRCGRRGAPPPRTRASRPLHPLPSLPPS